MTGLHVPDRAIMIEPLPVQHSRVVAALLLAALAMSAGAVQAQADAASMMARIEAPLSPAGKDLDALTLQALMAQLHVPGVSIAVIKDFKIHWAKGYGVADTATGRPVDTGTRFQAASISKPVTALAAMRLVQEHRLNLDADVNSMLKSWHVPKSELTRSQAVTPRSLFSHTSGADDGFGFEGYDPKAPLPTVVQILDGMPPSNMGKVTFARAPFEAAKYSGGGVMIMQLALTELSGRPFSQFMQSTVLGVGRYAVGLAIDQRGQGWYFSHNGSNGGYRAWLIGHMRKGYGLVVMANGDNGMALMNQIAGRVEKVYNWDAFEKPVSK